MYALSIYKEFIFSNSAEALSPIINEALALIRKAVQPGLYADEICFKVKSIITELLTNAIKHSGTDNVLLSIKAEGETLKILKKDKGNPFGLMGGASLTGVKKQLSYDIMHRLFAVSEADHTIRFFVEESDDDCPDINQVTEHYGLLIITKCADEFIYRFEHDGGANNFVASIHLTE